MGLPRNYLNFLAQRQKLSSTTDAVKKVEGQNCSDTKSKPTIDDMKTLFSSWNESPVVYFPAVAHEKSIVERRKKMEKYIKDNNLDIDVANLELFFDDVKKNMPQGGMISQDYLNKRLHEYIDSGWDQFAQYKQEKEHLEREKALLTGSVLSYYLSSYGASTVDTTPRVSTEDIEAAIESIEDHVDTTPSVFTEDIEAEIESIEDHVDTTPSVFTEDIEAEIESMEDNINKLKKFTEDHIDKSKNFFQ